jgi:DNA-binding MarR family transcriptional regulator
MSKINFGDDSKIIGVDTGAQSYTLPQHVTSVNGKTREEFENFGNADDIEEIIMTSDEPVADEEVQAPVEVAETLNETPESPVAPKRKSGRKTRKIEGVHATAEMIVKKNAIQASNILEITFKSMLEKALLELMVRELLSAYDIHEDSAPKLLVYMWDKAPLVEGRKTYLDTLQQTAEGAEIGYSNVQKLVKKLIEKGLLEKERNGLAFASLLENFFGSLAELKKEEDKQILLTFEHLKEEQMEAVDEDGKINEEMANQ